MTRGLLLILLLLPIGLGCTVGNGSGSADGTLFVLECKDGKDHGGADPAAWEPYELNPEFFAAEPIQDPNRGGSSNRLIIRLQRSGLRRELNDVLTFDVTNVYEVGRCVRGRVTTDGTPDWDPMMCDGSKVRVGSDALIRASLSPHGTCTRNVVASGISCSEGLDLKCQDQLRAEQGAGTGPVIWDPATWLSWIHFASFGAAGKDGDPMQRPALRQTFRIEFGDRVHADAFELLLQDDRVLGAQRRNETEPVPQIGAHLTGFFDFDLERGQGAQTFP